VADEPATVDTVITVMSDGSFRVAEFDGETDAYRVIEFDNPDGMCPGSIIGKYVDGDLALPLEVSRVTIRRQNTGGLNVIPFEPKGA
jgi:hypothetical protein